MAFKVNQLQDLFDSLKLYYLSMSRFVRTLSKIIFDPGELMVDSVKDIDKNKIAILLTETQEIAFYMRTSWTWFRPISIFLNAIKK